MGFRWSSCIAQRTLVAVSRGASIPDAQIISLDQPHPKDQSELVALATDDAIFVHTDKAAALQRLNDFDDSLLHYHVERNKAKDENARDHIIALGCSVGNKPAWVEPDCEKLLKLLLTFLGLTSNTSIRPRSLEGMLGIAQWFAQVPRWTFSVFNHIYDVQKSACADDPCTFNELCIAELHVYTLLAPLMVADLERQFLPFIACCDASPSFGFGVSVRHCDADTITDLASKSERHGDYLCFIDPDPSDKLQKRRGQPIRLPFGKESFTDVLSLRAKVVSHSGAMEAHGLLLLVQWVLRSRARFSSRLIAGIDATAVLAAALKGRSSAGTLRGTMRSVGAHCLAGDLLLYPLWVPSRHNPADAPSRGHRRRPKIRTKPSKVSRLEKFFKQREAALRRLRACHHLSSSESSVDSSRVSCGLQPSSLQ